MNAVAVYAAAAAELREELLDLKLPRQFKDLLHCMLEMCEAGQTFPIEYRDQYNKYLAYKQKVNRYGK